jgi:aldose 1-epimerase
MTDLSAAVASVEHTLADGFDAIRLTSGSLAAAFVPEVGMAGVSLRHQGDELLSREGGVGAYLATGAVMGIPLLHPWANRLDREDYEAAGLAVRLPRRLPRDDHGLPIHGVGPQPWRVVDVGADDDSAWLTAALEFDDATFPFPHRVEQRMTLRPSALMIETTLRAHLRPVPVSFGFHPYLRLPGVPREDWIVSLPARRRLLTDDRSIPSGATAHERAEVRPLGRRFFDAGYDELGREPRFTVSGGGRATTVRFLSGYPVAQVFAPCEQDVICFEPMTAPANALISGRGLRFVPPSGAFHAAFEISVASTHE